MNSSDNLETNALRQSLDDNSYHIDLVLNLVKLRDLTLPTMVDCYLAFKLKSTDFFVSQVNDNKIMDK